MATTYSSRNSALARRRRRLLLLLLQFGSGESASGSGSGSSSQRKEKTWSSRRIQSRARETRCGVEESWAGVGGEGRYRDTRLEPMSEPRDGG